MKHTTQDFYTKREKTTTFQVSRSMFHGRSGQSLVELMIAMSVLTTGFLGTLALLSRSLTLNRTVTDRNVATYLAAEGIEVVKNLVDANIYEGSAWNCGVNSNTYVVSYNSLPPGAACPGQGLVVATPANRQVYFDPTTNIYVNGNPGGSAVLTAYQRAVTVQRDGTAPDEDRLIVTATVTWTDVAGAEQVTLQDQFVNWRP